MFGQGRDLPADTSHEQARSPLVIVSGQTTTSTDPDSESPLPALSVHPDGSATLPRWEVTLTPFALTQGQARSLAAMLVATAGEHDVSPSPSAAPDPPGAYMNLDGSPRAELTTPRLANGDESSLLPEPDPAYLETAATTTDDLACVAPSTTAAGRDLIANSDPELDRDIAAWFDEQTTRPKITVLGPVGLKLTDDSKLQTFRNRGGIIEFLVYLACQEYGVTIERAADMLGWQPGTVQNRAGEARRAIGSSERGEDWLPDAQRSPSALARGIATYELLPGVLVDANLFRRLRLRAHARGVNGIDDLVTALRLVTGEPFSQLRRGGYGWLTEGDRLDHHLSAAVTDVAHLVVTRSLQEGNIQRARWAAEIALKATPYSDTSQLDLAAVMAAEGHPDVSHHVQREVLDRHDEDPSGRTADVVDHKRWIAS